MAILFGCFLTFYLILESTGNKTRTQTVVNMTHNAERRALISNNGHQVRSFPMMMGSPMAFPGNMMQGNIMSGSAQTQCITEDIVCPSWCLMEDEWGCKYCPCGPANGMSPPLVSNHKPATTHDRKEDNQDCIGTILCMLSCKDGYKLGSRSEQSGCQSCTCVKKNETENTTPASALKQDDCTGPACSAKNEGGTSTPSTNSTEEAAGNGCRWPLCMNGQGTGSEPGASASLSSSGTLSGGTSFGGSIPGIDCMGPACSAKNGMHFVSNSGMSPPSPPPQLQPTPPPQQPSTRPPQPASHKEESLVFSPTKPPARLYLVPVSTAAPEKHCARLEYCMNHCQYGFQVEHSRQECPNCNCIVPLTPPPPTTERPDFMSILRVCPDAVHCMKTCSQGYTLTTSQTEECPICTCNREPKILLLCEQPLSCSNGCTVGYRGNDVGCPTCNCVAPTETRLHVEVHTTIINSALSCNPKFSCVETCSLGYRTGDNGCPTCICLEPLTAGYQQPPRLNQVPVQPPGQHSGVQCIGPECSAIHAAMNFLPNYNQEPVVTNQLPFPSNINPSGTGCTGSECTAVLTPQRVVLLCEEPLSCPYGCTVGYKCDREGCPTCSCIAPAETTYKVEVHRIIVEERIRCSAQFSCVQKCSFGFKTGEDGCPTCVCLLPVGVPVQQPQPVPVIHVTQSPVGKMTQVMSSIITQMPLPGIGAPSGIGCLGPSCPSIEELSHTGNLFFSAIDNNHPMQQTGPSATLAPVVMGAQVPVLQGPVLSGTDSTGPKLVIHKPDGNIDIVQATHAPAIIHQQITSGSAPSQSKVQSAMESCPETVKCMVECEGTYNLTQIDNTICPHCICIHKGTGCIGPACSAPGSHAQVFKQSTPSPGECVAILHCVLTCKSGYDIGEYSEDGCPTCTCVE